MLTTLDLELRRKKQRPVPAIMLALGCSEKTARNKLNGITAITVPEAMKIIDTYFLEDDVNIRDLFTRERDAS